MAVSEYSKVAMNPKTQKPVMASSASAPMIRASVCMTVVLELCRARSMPSNENKLSHRWRERAWPAIGVFS